MKKITNQLGFAHQAVIIVTVVVGVVGFVGGSVYQSQQKNKESARQAAVADQERKRAELKTSTADEEGKETVEVPMAEIKAEAQKITKPTEKSVETTEQKKTSTEVRYIDISISSNVGATSVVLAASAAEALTGTCIALVELSDGTKQQWFQAALSSDNNCSITVPKSKLTDSTNWRYQMWMKNTSLTVKGQSSTKTFSL